MRSLDPWRDFRSSLNSRSHKKVCRCFCDSQCRFFFWFCLEKKKFLLSPLGWWRTILALIIVSTSMARPTVAKTQGNQCSQYSDVTNGRLVSSSACFSWNTTLKYKMKLSEGSWDKILHWKLRTQRFWKEDFFFWRFVSRSDRPKFRE